MNFIQKIKDFFIKGDKRNMKSINLINDIIKVNNIELTFDLEMYFNNVENWKNIYKGFPSWKDEETKLLNLASAICKEIAETTTIELNINIESTDLKKQEKLIRTFDNFTDTLTESLEFATALGGVIFKPFIENNEMLIQTILPTNFIPIQFNGKNEVIGAIFFEQIEYKEVYYTRVEKHEFKDNIYIVSNRLYKGQEVNTLGQEIPLNTLERFKNLNYDETFFNLEKPLFTYFKTPTSNNIEFSNPLGISHFYRAIDLLKDVDQQYSSLLWEFEGGELAVHIEDTFLFQMEKDNSFKMAKNKERLYRKLNTDTNVSNFLEVFSPQFRDVSLINGLNEILRKIENTCGLVHGTFSNAEKESKTATEIKLSKQRNYITITAYQKKLKKVFNDLLDIFNYYFNDYIREFTKENIILLIDFDDSVVTDIEDEFKRRSILLQRGIISEAEFRAWYFGETLEEATKKIPPKQLDFEIEE